MAKRVQEPDQLFQNAFQLSTAPGEALSILNEKVLAPVKCAARQKETGHVKWASSQPRNEIGAASHRAKMAGATLSEQLHAAEEAEKVSAAKWKDYRLAADTLKREARAIAESWINCSKQLGAPGADELYKRAEEFLKSNPQTLFPHPFTGFPILFYHRKKAHAVRDEIDLELGWLCLCLAASTWSQDLLQCPRCEDFYVRKRATKGATQGDNPGCCRACRRPLAESEETAKLRDEKREAMVRTAQAVIDELVELPVSERPGNWEDFVASEVTRRRNLKKPIKGRSITRWSEEGKIKNPWS